MSPFFETLRYRKIIQDELEASSNLAKRRTSNEETNMSRKVGNLQAPKGEYKASSLPWGSTTSPKRAYGQEEKGQLATPEGGYKASSLPRSTKISPSVSTPEVEEKGGYGTYSLTFSLSPSTLGGQLQRNKIMYENENACHTDHCPTTIPQIPLPPPALSSSFPSVLCVS